MFRIHANRSHKGTSVRSGALAVVLMLALVAGLGVAAPAGAAGVEGDGNRPGWAAEVHRLGDLLARWLGLGASVVEAPGLPGSESDDGPHMDPDGLDSENDDGPHMDPDG